MSTSAELMYAILAMDAYNRGYNPGMVLTGSQIGSATISTDSTENFRDPNADPEAPTPDQAAGFYAVAYEWKGERAGVSSRRPRACLACPAGHNRCCGAKVAKTSDATSGLIGWDGRELRQSGPTRMAQTRPAER